MYVAVLQTHLLIPIVIFHLRFSRIFSFSSLTIYPPPPAKGGISINSEDYKCLAVNEYLNDVIIDFYLKYLLNEILSPEDRRRTHVFSSHFFTRLANPYAINPAPGGESNDCFRYDNYDDDEDTVVKKAAGRLRHAGVQRWTKNINIFEKDFIIVPINEAWVTIYYEIV